MKIDAVSFVSFAQRIAGRGHEELKALGVYALTHAFQHQTAFLAKPERSKTIKNRKGLLTDDTGDVLGLRLCARERLRGFAAFQVVNARTK